MLAIESVVVLVTLSVPSIVVDARDTVPVAYRLPVVRLVVEEFNKLVLPKTSKVPLIFVFPVASVKKFTFSTHADPFQYKVEEDTVPSEIELGTLVQYVDVPFVASTWPTVPVALLESLNSPVNCNLEIVVVAKVVRPVFVIVEVAVMSPATRLDIVAFVVVELVTIRLTIVARVLEVNVSIVPTVAFSRLAKRLVEVVVAKVVEPVVTVRLPPMY